MKFSNYVPEISSDIRKQNQGLSNLASNLSILASSSTPKETRRGNSLGLDLGYGTWMGQEFAFRQNLVSQFLQFAKEVEEVRAPIHHIINEVFRRGFVWKPKFAVKCYTCKTEYQDSVEQCYHCDGDPSEEENQQQQQQQQQPPIAPPMPPPVGGGNTPDGPNQGGSNNILGDNNNSMAKQISPMGMDNSPQQQPPEKKKKKGNLRKPDYSERRRIDSFLKDSNIWHQSLEEVLRTIWFDINSIDDAFIYIAKEYTLMDDGTIYSKPVEIRRMNPGYMEFDLDMEGLPKNAHYMCQIHREESIQTEEGECSECENTLIPTMYRYYYQGQQLYFFENEIIHESKFMPSETFGFSPILTLMHKILTIKGMDRVLYRYFYERRTPSSLLLVSTDDAESLRKEREHINAEVRTDPSYVPIVAVSTKQSRGRVDMVRLFHTLQEMEYLPVREEIRERISAMWGVTPIWQASNDAASGLSLQSQQLVVMSRVVESDQRLIQEKILPKITESFGINDWVLELQQPEEKAEVTRISFAQQRISAINMLVSMGFTVELESDNVGLDEINFKISGQAMNPQQQMMGGGGGMGMPPPMGGAGGMGGGGMPMGTGEGVDPSEGMNGGGGNLPPTPLEKMAASINIMNFYRQMNDLGYVNPVVRKVSNDGKHVIFMDNSVLMKATLIENNIVKVEPENMTKQLSPRMHKHPGQTTYHDINIKHNDAGREGKEDDMLFGVEQPDVGY